MECEYLGLKSVSQIHPKYPMKTKFRVKGVVLLKPAISSEIATIAYTRTDSCIDIWVDAVDIASPKLL